MWSIYHKSEKLNLNIEKKGTFDPIMKKFLELDSIDKKILSYIQTDGKASLRTIATAIGSSVSAIKNHIDRLSEQGIIRDYIARIDCCKIGYQEMTLIYVKAAAKVTTQEVFEELSKLSALKGIYQVSGDFCIFCIAKCIEKMSQIELLEQIKRIEGVDDIRTEVILQRFKEDFRVDIPE